MIKSLRGNDDAYLTLSNNKTAIAVNTKADESLTVPPINKWGINNDIDTADSALGQVVWPVKATTQQYIFIDSPITGLNIRSSSAADTAAGLGARSVKITYQDENGIQQELIKELSGASPVNLDISTVGIFRMAIETTGDNNTNSGIISVQDGSSNILALIDPGEGQTQIAVQRIPDNVSAICKFHKVDFPGGNAISTATLRLRVRKPDGTILTKWDPKLSQDKTEDSRLYTTGGIVLNSGEWIFWEVVATGANNVLIRGSFDLEFFDIEE